MAWEARWRQRYYYRSRRIGSHVVKVYVGRGPAAEEAARQDAAKRADRAARRYEAEIEKALEKPAKELMSELNIQVNVAIHSALTAAGFHQHTRGRWRKKRYAKSNEDTNDTEDCTEGK